MEKIDIEKFKLLYLKNANVFQTFGYVLEISADELFLVDIKSGKKYSATLGQEEKGYIVSYVLSAQIESLPYKAIVGINNKMVEIALGFSDFKASRKTVQYTNAENFSFWVSDHIDSQDNGVTEYRCNLKKEDYKLEFELAVTDSQKNEMSRKFIFDDAVKRIIFTHGSSYNHNKHDMEGRIYFTYSSSFTWCYTNLITSKVKIEKGIRNETSIDRRNRLYKYLAISDILFAMMHNHEVSEVTNYLVTILGKAFPGLDGNVDNILEPYYGAPSLDAVNLVNEAMGYTSIEDLKPLDALLPDSLKHYSLKKVD